MTPIGITKFTIAFSVAALSGCASTPIQEINSGRATLLTETIYVDNYFTADFLIDFKDYGRRKASIIISDCQKGRGNIKVDATNGAYIENLMKSGTTLADKMFAAACQKIIPLSDKHERERAQINVNKTPEERQRERENLLLLMQMQQNKNAQDAADSRNQQLIDALKDSKKSVTNCTKDGFGKVTCITK